MDLFSDFAAAAQHAVEQAALLGAPVGVRRNGDKWIVGGESRGTEVFAAPPQTRSAYVPSPREVEEAMARSAVTDAEVDARVAREVSDRRALVMEEKCNACDRPLSRCRC